MAESETPARDATGQGVTPDQTGSSTTTTAPERDAKDADIERLKQSIAAERAKSRELETKIREREKAEAEHAERVATEQGNYKSLYEQHKAALEKATADRDALAARWRDAQTNAALSTALGSQVVDGSTAHVMTALAPALTVDDDGSVAVDMTRVASIRSAKALDTTKVKDLQSLVTAFLEANPFFAASKAAGGAGSGGTGQANGTGSFDSAIAGWDKLTKDQQDTLWAVPEFRAAVSARIQKPATP